MTQHGIDILKSSTCALLEGMISVAASCYV
jgi:hypothetical protein